MESNGNKKPVRLDERVKQVGGTLIIKEARVEDSGKYLCMVNNSVGGESVETVLTVTGLDCSDLSDFRVVMVQKLNSFFKLLEILKIWDLFSKTVPCFSPAVSRGGAEAAGG